MWRICTVQWVYEKLERALKGEEDFEFPFKEEMLETVISKIKENGFIETKRDKNKTMYANIEGVLAIIRMNDRKSINQYIVNIFV